MQLRQEPVPPVDADSDVDENLDHVPVLAHALRSQFINQWLLQLDQLTWSIPHQPDHIMNMVLGHLDVWSSKPCVKLGSTPPSAHTVDHLRTKLTVQGRPWTWGDIQRCGDRHIRPYHMWMYGRGPFTREQLGRMHGYQVTPSIDAGGGMQYLRYLGDDGQVVKQPALPDTVISASHVDGDNNCIVHPVPELMKTNNERKSHHDSMRSCLLLGNIQGYRNLRDACRHEPKCFINPYSVDTMRIAIQQTEEYQAVLASFPNSESSEDVA